MAGFLDFIGNIFGGSDSKKPNIQTNAPNSIQDTEISPNTLSTSMSRTKSFEGGHKSSAYLDSLGKPTIGSGELLENTQYTELPQQYKTMNISEEEGDKMFRDSYNTKKSEVENQFGENWGSLPPEAQNVLVDMSYNVGTEGLFKKFPGLIKDLKSGNFENAANQLKYKDITKGDEEGNTSSWWTQVGGSTTESNISSGKWAGNARSGNRATSNYDTLFNLGNQSTVSSTMDNYEETNLDNYLLR